MENHFQIHKYQDNEFLFTFLHNFKSSITFLLNITVCINFSCYIPFLGRLYQLTLHEIHTINTTFTIKKLQM